MAQADGRPADAVALLWQLHRRDRANLDVANRLLGLLRQLGDDAQIEALVDSLDRWANSTQRRVTVARLLVHHDLNQQALSMTNGYARQGGDADADARLVRAVALWQMGQRQQASEALALVKRGRPASAGPSVPVVAWAAETLIGQGALGPADALIAAATTTTPDDPSLQLVRAHSLAARGDHAQAVRICNKAAEAAPGNLAVQIDLAIALDRAGRWQEAVARAEAVLRDHPAHVDAINLIGYVLADRNHDLQRAGKMIRVARQLAPLRPDIIDSQGWLSFRRGELTQARRALVIAHRFTPDDPVVLVHLAEVDAALGHGHEAIAGFQHALRLCRDPAQCARWRGRLRALRHAGPPDAATKDSSR